MPERLGRRLSDARGRGERVAEYDRELAVRHRERRIQGDRLSEQRHRAIDLPRVIGPQGLGVLPQRLERSRRHLLERLARTDRPERLADPLPEPPR